MPSVLRPTVFLDRDGTLNEMVYDESHGVLDSPFWPEHLVLKREAGPFVRALNQLGFMCPVVTNQPGIAKGFLTPMRLDRIHRHLHEELARSGAHLDGIFYCPHHPDPGSRGREDLAIKCHCRKPAPGLIFEAAAVLHSDLDRSYMVGDGLTDMEAGRAAGVTTVLVSKLKPETMERIQQRPEARPDHVVSDLNEALNMIRSARDDMIAAHRS